MEGGESSEPTTPFWARTDSSSSSSSSSNSSMKPLMASALAASIFFIIFFPSILSSSSKASFRLSLFKNRWDLLNFVLVVFAVLCGVLGRNTTPAGDDTDKTPPPISTPATATTFRRMRSSSYPDLRQESSWGPPADDSWRFSDDIEVYRNHHWRSDHPRLDRRHLHDEPIVKIIQVDTMEVKPSSAVRSRSPPPPPPPPPRPRQHHHQPRKRQAKRSDIPPPPPPPTPPRQKPVIERKLHRKKSTGAKDIAAALALFYQTKRKRGSSKIKKIHNSNDEVITDYAAKPTTPPPPPPPPPPSSMFHNLFASSKKGSSKKKSPNPIGSSPPPPSPPPLPSLPTSRRSATKYSLPPSPLRPWQPHSSSPSPKVNPKIHYLLSNSFELPPPPLPPPPSLPPSPQPSFVKEAAAEPLFCPSPDVNNKAEMFIARFRAGLKLEKLNSIRAKEKQPEQEQEQQEEQDGN